MTTPRGAKPNTISKREVYSAWLKVKANRGSPGADDISLEQYETKLAKNLYKLWNRMSSGSYFPQAIKRVEIPKKDGGVRPLGIPTVSDRVAQEVVRARLDPELEKIFHEDSYGYRRGKSALDAVGVCRERNWRYDWVVDVDIKKFFDTIDHELLMKAVRKHAKEQWEVLYIERWLKAPILHKDGKEEGSSKGTPQGGVISPLLANLYLHYAFDLWMKRTYPEVKFERYADDMVIHVRSEKQAQELKEALSRRLADCGLELHPEKTRVAYCKDKDRKKDYPHVSYTFLGYTFKPRKIIRKDRKKASTSFLPAASTTAKKHLRMKLRQLRIAERTQCSPTEFADKLNPILRGWLNYFSRYYRSSLDMLIYDVEQKILRWIMKKYRIRITAAVRHLERWKLSTPKQFVHWQPYLSGLPRRAV